MTAESEDVVEHSDPLGECEFGDCTSDAFYEVALGVDEQLTVELCGPCKEAVVERDAASIDWPPDPLDGGDV